MKLHLFPKLAWEGIRKNKRLYIPYIITCTGMIMMHYIVFSLAVSPVLLALRGGETITVMMELGAWILGIFAVLFLFYTNSFLMRRRRKEFGLYNILGMGKLSISRILLWESLYTALFSALVGSGLGIALSKLFELLIVNLMSGDVSYTFSVSLSAVGSTLRLYGVIFLLLLLNDLRQITVSNPVALLNSENAGEKAPKANWFWGCLSVIMLLGAYYLAVSIQEPLAALNWFFIAVAVVIAATYLLFISGSVMLCRILQKCKQYYYKANHFVSVSSMAFRMKRNGAGLASICILLTMVLVMLTGSMCLYLGTEDSLRSRYPMDIQVTVWLDTEEISDDQADAMRQLLQSQTPADASQIMDYRYAGVTGLTRGDRIVTDPDQVGEFSSVMSLEGLAQVYFIPLADFNRMTGAEESLSPGEALLYSPKLVFPGSALQIGSGQPLAIRKELDTFFDTGMSAMDMVSTVYLVIPDLGSSLDAALGSKDSMENGIVYARWCYGFNTELPPEEQIALSQRISESLAVNEISRICYSNVECLEDNRVDFYSSNGGVLALGILLSIVFLSAAVLIIYYKQISEGYEDQARFSIMQRVGMTKKEIRRSINSQMLTVFFLPLITAGVHLGFAFPFIQKLLLFFNLWNEKLLIAIALGCFLIFALLYVAVYRVTSNAFFSIVSGARED